jgi:hypothetical protein
VSPSGGGWFSGTDVHWVLEGHARAWACGAMVWTRRSGSHRAQLAVAALGRASGDLTLYFRVPEKRSAEPSLVLQLLGECIFRLDVNGGHTVPNGGPRYELTTHTQTRFVRGGPESFDPAPVGVPIVDPAVRVRQEQYREIFQAFGRLSNVDLSAVTWEDVPEGRIP